MQKHPQSLLSNPLEMEKTLKIAFPTPWKQKKHLKAALQPLGSRKMDA